MRVRDVTRTFAVGAAAFVLAAGWSAVAGASDTSSDTDTASDSAQTAEGTLNINVNETSPNKGGFQYNNNNHLASNQEMIGVSAYYVSQACLLDAACTTDQSTGGVSFGSESMKLFAGVQNMSVNTSNGGNAQAQAALVAQGVIHINVNP